MSIQPAKTTTYFFRNLGSLSNTATSDLLPPLLQVARNELLIEDTDCLLPLDGEMIGAVRPCFEDEVYTRRVKSHLNDAEGRYVSFVYSLSAPAHTDYPAITHLLILQADGHALRIKELAEDNPCKVGDIVQFNIDWSHELIASMDTKLPFVALSYDAYTSDLAEGQKQYPALNRKNAIPFFQALVEEIVSNA